MVTVMLMYVETPDLRDLLELMEGGGEEFVITKASADKAKPA